MRVRICRQPTGTIEGVHLDQFRTGRVYDISTRLAGLFLAEGWAESVEDDGPARQDGPSAGRVAAVVLVVDDHPDMRRLTALILSRNGYDVIEAENGREAIASLCRHAPDLVILDLNMPVMDGWQFRAEQQRLADGRLAAIPVLLVTGAEGSGEQVSTLKAVGLVRKPFEPAQLLEAIERAMPR